MIGKLLASLALVGALSTTPASAATISEYRLPGFQTAALEQDLPAVDALLAGNKTLWFLGRQNLWTWQLAEGRLTRIALPKDEWQKLHFDGLSVYAAGAKSLFQVQIAQKRYLAYDLPLSTAGDSLGFGGEGDELWLVHSTALMKLDRYGKALTPKAPSPPLQKGDLVAFDAQSGTLWVARGKQLLRLNDNNQFKTALTAKNALTGLALSDGQVILHTEHSVLRLDAKSGKTLKSIPVQGGHKLATMTINSDQHVYVFDDHLVEAFDLKAKLSRSYRLPLEPEDKIDRVTAVGDTAAVLVNGRPRAYQLSKAIH